MDKEHFNPDAAVQRGWLDGNYRLFSLNSRETEQIPSHFHSFHKLIFLRNGQLSYLVEGTLCTVCPGELLLVPAFSVHRPLIGPEPYDRIVLWISPEAPEAERVDLAFRLAESERNYLCACPEAGALIRQMAGEEGRLPEMLYGEERLNSALLTQTLVLLARAMGTPSGNPRGKQNRTAGEREPDTERPGRLQDDRIMEILTYISAHLEEPLTAETLSGKFYLSESCLSHRFRQAAGCTLHQFVLQKRLARAAGLLKQGYSAAEAAQRSGFSDYSTFYRAFTKAFEIPPGSYAAGLTAY